MSQAFVRLEKSGGIGTITFFHPSSNAMPGHLLKQLSGVISQAGADTTIKVIVLQSEGRTFCAGASFDELISLKDMDSATSFFMGFANVILAMRQVPKFVIAKVQGKAVGGGVGLIAAADYAMATDLAAVKLSELSIGIGPYVIAPAVRRKIGTAAFSELTINATTWHTAFWGREKGLFAKVFDNLEILNDEVELLAGRLVKYDENATKLLKQELWRGTEHWPQLLNEQAQISAKLVLQDFTKNILNSLKK